MKIYLIDFENVHSEGMQGVDNLTEEDEVVIFYSQNADSISFDVLHKLMFCKAKLNYFKIRRGGKNALDFQLSTYLGYRTLTNPQAEFYIISKDAGFDFVIDFWSYGYVAAQPIIRRFVSLKSVFIWESSQKVQRTAARSHAEKAIVSLINNEEPDESGATAETEPSIQPQAEEIAQPIPETAAQQVESAPAQDKPAPKRRGRKPKNHNAQAEAPVVVAAPAAPAAEPDKPQPKRRGRKPKVRTEEAAVKPEVKAEAKPEAKAEIKPAKAQKADKAQKAAADKAQKPAAKKTRGRKPGRPANKPAAAKTDELKPSETPAAQAAQAAQAAPVDAVIKIDAQDQGQTKRPRRGRPPKKSGRIAVTQSEKSQKNQQNPTAQPVSAESSAAAAVEAVTAAPVLTQETAAVQAAPAQPVEAVIKVESAESKPLHAGRAVKITHTRANSGRANKGEPAQLTEEELDIVQGLMRTAKSRNGLYLSTMKQFGHSRGGEIYAAVKNTFSVNRAKETAQQSDLTTNESTETEAVTDGDIKIQGDEE
jgi:hypothetical protein